MITATRHTALKLLTALAVALAAGTVDAADELLTFPEPLIKDVIDDPGDAGDAEAQHERAEVLALLANDPRPAVRSHVAEAAEALADFAPREAQSLLRALGSDATPEVRTAAAAALGALLTHSSPLYRLAMAAEWAGSKSPRDREVLAHALCGPVPAFLTDVLLERLASDPEPAVRERVLVAAGRHFHENPPLYGRVARALAGDSDKQVRQAARRLLKRLG